MTTLTIEGIEKQFINIEHEILYEVDMYFGRKSNASWAGIDFEWKAQALKNGGKLKRNKVYGNIHYYYMGKELSRTEAIEEASKPQVLRQALIEASASIECSVCGLVVVGKDALEPHRDIQYYDGKRLIKPNWGHIICNRIESKSLYLDICPNCLQRIANGEFRDN